MPALAAVAAPAPPLAFPRPRVLLPIASAPPEARSRRAPVIAHDARELSVALVRILPDLRARARHLCGDSALADDVVQDAVERALRFEAGYQRGTNVRAWALQILFNVFVTRWRRRRRERRALARLADDPSAWTFPDCFARPDAGEGCLTPSASRALATLPDPFRKVIVLVDLERRSYKDAARALGVPVGTVMSRVHRARRRLAVQMTEERAAA